MTGSLIAECMLRIATGLALLGFSGCAGPDAPAPSGQPSFYRNLAEGGQLDPAAAQSMISGYRANNGLGAVVLDPALMKLAEEQSRAMVTRGWLDPQNRNSLTRSDRVEPGERYTMRWDLQPDDHVFRAGHRIGLVVVSTDHDYTIRPRPGTQLTLAPNASDVSLPVVGGAAALR